jgi:hypothetical protein
MELALANLKYIYEVTNEIIPLYPNRKKDCIASINGSTTKSPNNQWMSMKSPKFTCNKIIATMKQ